ncbi:hypothetical protein NHX12_023071, partial [Muraenolepis orangiensis]
PTQRLEIFCSYAIPRALYMAVNSSSGQTCLRSADSLIRRKLWLAGGGSSQSLLVVQEDLTNVDSVSYRGPECWRAEEFRKWSNKNPQGFGVYLYEKDKISNAWGVGRAKWKESHFIRALQMRCNMLPTLELGNRFGLRGGIPLCRACGKASETGSHILGSCSETKLNRMARHNKLCSLLAQEGAKRNGRCLANGASPKATALGQSLTSSL